MNKELLGKYLLLKGLYEKGYAIPLTGNHSHLWVHYDKEIILPLDALEIVKIDNVSCALWTDVQNAEKK
jgi:hypothetical protein